MSSIVLEDKDRQVQNHAVIILASGLSQRLGQPKQLLVKNGELLIVHMIRWAVSTNPQAVIVVIPDKHPAIASVVTELAVQYPAVQAVVNPKPETGMADSLRLGIASLGNSSIERVLIMGVDQVLLDQSHLTALLAGEQSVVASSYLSWTYSDELSATEPKNIIGLPLVIDTGLLRQWQTELTGDKGLRYLIRALPPSQIHTVINKQLSYDIDTPAQLAFAQKKGWLDQHSERI
ncbi:nucleotidyltransferase family protein [Psychrobacter pacificensis]|uniref:nucleotidyltransferase family protein n=1 Tax=Psychrobacter pacificensis TaxID=112002 RepID=UPI003CFE43AA